MKPVLTAVVSCLLFASLGQAAHGDPLISAEHAANLRRMLQVDRTESQIDGALPRLRSDMLRRVAENRHEASLTGEETAQFETVSGVILEHLKQQLIDYSVLDYADLSDAEIHVLIKANTLPLAQKFLDLMAQSQETDELTLRAYAAETAEAISLAFTQRSPYLPRGPKTYVGEEAPEGRLFAATGNDVACDEGVKNYWGPIVAGYLTQIQFDKLSSDDKDRIMPLLVEGLRDFDIRLKVLKIGELRNAFSKDELEHLREIYTLPSVQHRARIVVGLGPIARKRNQLVIRAAYDEVMAAFAVTP